MKTQTRLNRFYSSARNICVVISSCGAIFATNLLAQESSSQRYFEYQDAAQYSHLLWQSTLKDPISIELKAIKNFSGIPIDERDEDETYFYHGKLPTVMNAIYADAFRASRLFNPVSSNGDYRVELILDSYKLPFDYAPDDTWWQALHDDADRWLQTVPHTYVKLSVKLTSGRKKLKSWMDSVEMTLSSCDLNASPQPATYANNNNELARKYLATTPGQTFLAATNFLILQMLERLNEEPLTGKVEKIYGQEVYITSDSASFVEGKLVDVYLEHEISGTAPFPAGQLKIIKTMQNRAIAYPVSLRADHIKPDDWVALSPPVPMSQPKSKFIAANQCAPVHTASVES